MVHPWASPLVDTRPYRGGEEEGLAGGQEEDHTSCHGGEGGGLGEGVVDNQGEEVQGTRASETRKNLIYKKITLFLRGEKGVGGPQFTL